MQNYRPRLYSPQVTTSNSYSLGSRFFVFILFIGLAMAAWFLAVFDPGGKQDLHYLILMDGHIHEKKISLSDSNFVVSIKDSKTIALWHSNMNADKIVLKEEDFEGVKGKLDLMVLLKQRIGEKDLRFEVEPRYITYEVVAVSRKQFSIDCRPFLLSNQGWEVVGDIEVSPKTIEVYGSEKVLERMEMVEFLPQKIKETAEKQNLELKLKLASTISSKLEVVKVSFKAQRFMIKSLVLSVQPPELEHKVIRLLPAQVNVDVKIPLMMGDRLSEKSLQLTLDTAGMSMMKPLQVVVKENAENIEIIRITPSVLDYVILDEE